MTWETRKGEKYYYRKRRVGDRVVSEYIGPGKIGQLAAHLDELKREQRAAERDRWREEREAARAIDAEVNQVCDLIRTLTCGALLVSGYHTHKGQWRKKRNG